MASKHCLTAAMGTSAVGPNVTTPETQPPQHIHQHVVGLGCCSWLTVVLGRKAPVKLNAGWQTVQQCQQIPTSCPTPGNKALMLLCPLAVAAAAKPAAQGLGLAYKLVPPFL